MHKSPHGYFYRIGSSKREMPPDMLARLFQQRSQTRLISFDEQVVPGATPSTLSKVLFEKFKSPLSPVSDDDFLRKLHFVANDAEGSFRPTVGGILMASAHPEEHLPSAYIQAVCYRGKERNADEQLDARDIFGPLDFQIAEACRFVNRNMRTLAVNTLVRENGKNDGVIAKLLKKAGLPFPAGWKTAPRTRVPGYHAKGLCSGFGRVFVSNNGEDTPAARRDPFVPSGVLAWWNEPGRDWSVIRRCQFTEVTTPDGIYGNEHPAENPVWAMGWDAKSVILGVTTNGTEWAYYRLPKASHAYDGAHGWNTEWPRIRDVGFGDGTLLATMHGTFWRFPRGFSPANPNGIRPISTYLKVIGDFCRWGDRIVLGCDDQTKSEFLGKRSLKKDAPRCKRSQSNLWFVKPEELKSFGPPSGEGYVWIDEDVKAGDISDPYLYAGYETMRFSFVRTDGTPVRHELLKDGDWVRVKCLEDAKGATACFRYGPAEAKPPSLDAKNPFITVTDDKGEKWRFPNVNGDTNVVCREIATERDLLYVGGVWYEVPADNAGGFSALRPVALADEPVKSLYGERGLMYLNGKAAVIDDLWKNGTAPAAYWLWEKYGK